MEQTREQVQQPVQSQGFINISSVINFTFSKTTSLLD